MIRFDRGARQVASVPAGVYEEIMATLQDSIAEKFLKSLANVKELDEHAVEQLRTLLASGGKSKADDFAKIFTTPADGEVK